MSSDPAVPDRGGDVADVEADDERFHVKCRNPACATHLRVRGEREADRVAALHERQNDHDVDVIPDDVVSFSTANTLPNSSTSTK